MIGLPSVGRSYFFLSPFSALDRTLDCSAVNRRQSSSFLTNEVGLQPVSNLGPRLSPFDPFFFLHWERTCSLEA